MLAGSARLDAIDDKRAEVRCLGSHGAGRAFCTGANLQGRTIRSRAEAMPGRRWKPPFTCSCGGTPLPDRDLGHRTAAGAGMSFALMGDMILCARRRGSAGLPPHRPGADCGSTRLLPRLIGKARSDNCSAWRAPLKISRKASRHLLRSAPGEVQRQMIEEELGRCVATLVVRRLASLAPQNFRRRQSGDLDLRYPARRQQFRRDPRRAPPGYGASPLARRRARCRGR